MNASPHHVNIMAPARIMWMHTVVIAWMDGLAICVKLVSLHAGMHT